MLFNYFKILFRKQPIFTLINIFGLVIGMTSVLLLFKYIRYETTYDLQSPHAKNIWRVFNQTAGNNSVITKDANTHSAIGPKLKAEVPGVIDFARLYYGDTPEVSVLANEKPFEIKKYFATDQGFLRMFPQKFLFGNTKNCLEAPHTAVLSKSNAVRIFGTENALNKQLKIRNGMMAGDYTITGIVNDPPQNTHLKFDLLVSYATKYANGHQDNFESYWDYNYFQLAPNANPESVRLKLAQINEQFLKKENIQLDIQPFTDIHLKSNLTYELEPNGNIRTIQFLSIIAVLILFMAFINYINLTTALANERAKEVGIRKVLGANRDNIIKQFLIESFAIGLLSFALAAILLNSSIGWFSAYIGKPLIEPNAPFDFSFWGLNFLFIAALSSLIGLYPSFQLSNFKPSDVFRGKFSISSVSLMRKGLVIFQFVGSALLIIGVLVVKNQMDFMSKHELGVNLDQIVAIKSLPSQNSNDTLTLRKLSIFKSEISKLTGVKSSASSSIVPGLGINTISGSNRPLHWTKKPDFAKTTSYFVETDEQFFNLYGIKILAGKHKYFEDRTTRFRTVTINQTMLKTLGFQSPESAIGELIAYENSENGATMTIGAVIEDFHIESLKTTPHPTLYYCFAPDRLNYLSIKIEASQMQSTLQEMQSIWKKIYSDQSFSYWFLDENFANLYQSELQFSKVFGSFSILAILISCLGLLGLVAFGTQRRSKEIGIRKVLGSSITGIVILLSKEYLKLILIAILLASPIAYFLMNNWLAEYAYRIEISWWIFGISSAIIILISLFTISYQAIKSALINPVKSLKTE